MLAFADHLLLITSSRIEMARALTIVKNVAAGLGLPVNCQKSTTFFLFLGRKSKRIEVNLDVSFKILYAISILKHWKHIEVDLEMNELSVAPERITRES